MKKLSIREKFYLYVNSFKYIGTFLLEEDLKEIDYYIFEEFDSDCISFFHNSTLVALLDKELISKNVYLLSMDLARKFRDLENTSLWNSTAVKHDPKWLEILMIADEIKILLNIS